MPTQKEKIVKKALEILDSRPNGIRYVWLVESFLSVFKRWFGEHIVSRKFENIRKEIVFKVGIINMFLMAGEA
jgi:hypothetical protein